MFPTATALSVDEAAKAQLESLVRSGTTPQRVAQKCRVILLAQEGMSNHSIAKQLGLSRPTVIAARATFGTGGVQALTAKPTRNRLRRTLTPELEKKILDTTLKTRPPDATQWTVRTLAKHLRVSRMMVHRVWQRFDIQPHRVEKFKLSNDPQFEEKVRDIAGLYLDPPERALVLCVDEKSQIQALDRTAPILPLRPGLPERQTHDYKRNGTTTLFAAFNILNGKVIGSCLPRHRGKESRRSFSIKWRSKSLPTWTCTSFWTTTARTRAPPQSGGSNPESTAISISTSPPPAVLGSIRWNASSL